MLTFLRICGWIVVGIAALVGISYLLPRHVIVERQIHVAAPPEVVFDQVNSLQAFSEWSPWSDRDPEMTQNFSGPVEGVGNRMSWSSEDPAVGSGSQIITQSLQNERVQTELDFDEMRIGKAWFVLSPDVGGTLVTWGLDADMGNRPIGRYMGLMMDRWVGPDYETGLERLKARAETPAAKI